MNHIDIVMGMEVEDRGRTACKIADKPFKNEDGTWHVFVKVFDVLGNGMRGTYLRAVSELLPVEVSDKKYSDSVMTKRSQTDALRMMDEELHEIIEGPGAFDHATIQEDIGDWLNRAYALVCMIQDKYDYKLSELDARIYALEQEGKADVPD